MTTSSTELRKKLNLTYRNSSNSKNSIAAILPHNPSQEQKLVLQDDLVYIFDEQTYSNADEYQKHHNPQAQDALKTLRKYDDQLNWKKYTRIMDIGCGTGDFTYNHILPLLSNEGQITAVDISLAMIDYARDHFRDSRLKFDVMDAQNEQHAKRYKNKFDMIFSSYCLHWIHNQRKTMENIFSILKNGGDFIAFFVANAPHCTLCEELMNHHKWKPYISTLENLIYPYQHDRNPETTLKTLLEDIGFTVNECVIMEKSYTFSSLNSLLQAINAACQVTAYLPGQMMDEYKLDCLSILKEKKLYECEDNSKVSISYTMFNVYCKKPFEV